MATQLEIMASIATAMDADPFYLFLSEAASKPLVKKGFAIVNPDIQDEDFKYATRLTDTGMAFLKENSTVSNTAEKKPATEKMSYVIETVPMPAGKTRKPGAGRPSKYPFDALEVGQMFFVPASADQPEPEKTMASVVAAANRRYATETDQFKKNRKGEDIPVLEYTRKFVVRLYNKPSEDGHITGAGVWREK